MNTTFNDRFGAARKEIRASMTNLFFESIRRIDVRSVLTQRMTLHSGRLQIDQLSYRLSEFRRIVIVAAGKAAIPMCSTTAEIMRPALRDDQILRGIAIGPDLGDPLPPEVTRFPGSHPFPDQASRNAAEAVRDLLSQTDSRDLVLFLISGGASSMLETPLSPDISVEETRDFYRMLVHSGLPIEQINTLRKHLSAVKGGRLAELAAPAMQCTLIVSDTPPPSLDSVGSGPSLPDKSTLRDCREIMAKNPALLGVLDPKVRKLLLDPNASETPKSGDQTFSRSETICLLSNDNLLEQLEILAKQNGFHVEIDNTCDDWYYQDAAKYLVGRVDELRKHYPKVCLLSGGEVTVKVPSVWGMGGRNQQFALYTALQLAELDPFLAALSAGSDGIDGNSPAAGAIVDSFTIADARASGLDPERVLERFDSYSFFETLQGAIVTGPTGNNVRDVRILLSQPIYRG